MIVLSSLMLLVAGDTVVACVTAVACIQTVAGILAVAGVLEVSEGFLMIVCYRTIRLWLSNFNFFQLSNYQNIKYCIGKLKKLGDYRMLDQALNLYD